MLLNYFVENFKSFGTAQKFSMIPTRNQNHRDHVFEENTYKALKMSAIYGGNASGKSNFVESIFHLRNIVLAGEVRRILSPCYFKLKDLGQDTRFEVEIGIGDRMFLYAVSVNTVTGEVKNEYIYENRGGSLHLFFDIDRNSSNIEFNNKLICDANKERFKIYHSDLSSSQLLLTRLAKATTEMDEMFEVASLIYGWFSKLVIINPHMSPANLYEQFCHSDLDNGIKSIIELIRSFDTGITNYKYEHLTNEQFNNVLKNSPSLLPADIVDVQNEIMKVTPHLNLEIFIDGKLYRATKKESEIHVELVMFEHCGNSEPLFSFHEESDGTKRLLELINVLYSSQFEDRVFIIDEIERSLHANLTTEFLRAFLELSRKAAQLIITTHETSLMDLSLLRPDEIWLLDRNSSGMSSFTCLSEYVKRNDKVIDKDYLDGRYGGISTIVKVYKGDGFSDGETLC